LTRRAFPGDHRGMLRSRLIRILVVLSCVGSLAGCDACGEWPWTEKQKSCHGEPMQ
jgi:hypothetical protein